MTTLSRLFATLSLTVTVTGALVQTLATPAALSIGLSMVNLTIGMYEARAEVATTPQAHEIGPMFRRTVPDTVGMLLVLDESVDHCPQVKNVDLLLSIAFITDDDIVFDIAEVKPWTEDNHYPTRAGSYTLEMNRGWLARKGVKPNIKVGGLPH